MSVLSSTFIQERICRIISDIFNENTANTILADFPDHLHRRSIYILLDLSCVLSALYKKTPQELLDGKETVQLMQAIGVEAINHPLHAENSEKLNKHLEEGLWEKMLKIVIAGCDDQEKEEAAPEKENEPDFNLHNFLKDEFAPLPPGLFDVIRQHFGRDISNLEKMLSFHLVSSLFIKAYKNKDSKLKRSKFLLDAAISAIDSLQLKIDDSQEINNHPVVNQLNVLLEFLENKEEFAHQQKEKELHSFLSSCFDDAEMKHFLESAENAEKAVLIELLDFSYQNKQELQRILCKPEMRSDPAEFIQTASWMIKKFAEIKYWSIDDFDLLQKLISLSFKIFLACEEQIPDSDLKNSVTAQTAAGSAPKKTARTTAAIDPSGLTHSEKIDKLLDLTRDNMGQLISRLGDKAQTVKNFYHKQEALITAMVCDSLRPKLEELEDRDVDAILQATDPTDALLNVLRNRIMEIPFLSNFLFK